MADEAIPTLIEIQEVAKKALHLAAQIQSHANDLAALLVVLKEKSTPRAMRELDDNKEPTFNFSVAVKMPQDFYLTKKMAAYPIDTGLFLSGQEVTEFFKTFTDWYSNPDKGGKKKWQHWSKVWFDWCRREKKKLAETGGTPRQVRSSRSLPNL